MKRLRQVVIVPTLGRPDDVEALLASLEAQTQRPEAILVVDDTEGDAVHGVVARHPQATYIRNPGARSAAGARNIGARHELAAQADLLTFLDSDSILEADYLRQIQSLLSSRPDAIGAMGYVTGQRRNGRFKNAIAAFFGLSRPSSKRAWLSPSLYSLYPLDITEVTATNWLWGCNLTVRRTAFEAVGGFHPQMLRYSYLEDLELGLHLLQAHPDAALLMTPAARLRHAKSPADRISTLDTERMRIVHRNMIVRRYSPRRWYRGPQVFWSDVGTVLIKHYRRPWHIPAQLWNVVSTWSLVLRYRKDLDRGDLSGINRHYRFARASKP